MSAIRYHFDAYCSKAVAKGLRRLGIDATTASEVSLADALDTAHLDYARTTGRAIFTRDRDFVELHHRGIAQPHPGIVYCSHDTNATIGEMIRGLELIAGVFDAEELVDTLQYLTENIIRGPGRHRRPDSTSSPTPTSGRLP